MSTSSSTEEVEFCSEGGSRLTAERSSVGLEEAWLFTDVAVAEPVAETGEERCWACACAIASFFRRVYSPRLNFFFIGLGATTLAVDGEKRGGLTVNAGGDRATMIPVADEPGVTAADGVVGVWVEG
jgi:hypothetical protein